MECAMDFINFCPETESWGTFSLLPMMLAFRALECKSISSWRSSSKRSASLLILLLFLSDLEIHTLFSAARLAAWFVSFGENESKCSEACITFDRWVKKKTNKHVKKLPSLSGILILKTDFPPNFSCDSSWFCLWLLSFLLIRLPGVSQHLFKIWSAYRLQ